MISLGVLVVILFLGAEGRTTTKGYSGTTTTRYPYTSTTRYPYTTTTRNPGTTTPGYPTTTTRYPYTTTSKYPQTTTTRYPDASTTTTSSYSEEGCPPGWVNSLEGCFLFHFTQKVAWREAQEECERLGGFLAEVKSEEQATLLTSIAFVEEAVVGMHAWWIGLTDQGHEGRWIWQHSVEDALYTNWAPSYPRNTNNGNDCVVMDSKDIFEWSDVDCGGFLASPVCQRYTNERTTTTGYPATTTTRYPYTTTTGYPATTTTRYLYTTTTGSPHTTTTRYPYTTTTGSPHTTTTRYPYITTTPASQYYVELRGGSSNYAGNVFAVNYKGFFGPVCDDSWGNSDATVVCRQLGFSGGVANVESYFGNVPEIFAMDDVGCFGNEHHIQDCSYTIGSAINCHPGEGAGVSCFY